MGKSFDPMKSDEAFEQFERELKGKPELRALTMFNTFVFLALGVIAWIWVIRSGFAWFVSGLDHVVGLIFLWIINT